MRTLWIALLLVPRLVAAEPAKLTLDQVIAKAVANPRVQMAQSDRDSASARSDEADAARLPRVKVTAFATLSPEIHCNDDACTSTTPKNFALRFSGFFEGAEIDVTQPLYTFGKIQHARNAAKAGVEAQTALADEAAGDAVSDAARAYWGLKLARELGGMLDDGIEQIEDAKKHFDENKSITFTDRQRVAVLLAQAKAQRADAAQGEGQALAGLRAITGTADADIDDVELAPVEFTTPKNLAVDRRPQRLAARSGATAAEELLAMEKSYYYPDIALVGSALWASAHGVQDAPGVFANDPYNRAGAGLVVGLQWTLEPWNVKARADRAGAEAHKMRSQAQLAEIGARYDADTALAEAGAAHTKVDASKEGEKAARTWLASVLQNEAIGTAESRDLVDAYVGWFTLRAQWAQAVVAWNVAVIRLGRATGEFRAAGPRPR